MQFLNFLTILSFFLNVVIFLQSLSKVHTFRSSFFHRAEKSKNPWSVFSLPPFTNAIIVCCKEKLLIPQLVLTEVTKQVTNIFIFYMVERNDTHTHTFFLLPNFNILYYFLLWDCSEFYVNDLNEKKICSLISVDPALFILTHQSFENTRKCGQTGKIIKNE